MTVEPNAYSELVDSLREQLKLQQAINSQYEVDVEARDELVSMLQTRLKYSEDVIVQHCAELENRRMSNKAMCSTIARLEKLCRGLEEELERSREESRIIPDVPAEESEDDANRSRTQDDRQDNLLEQQIEELTQQLKSKEAEVDLLNQERQYALDNTSRLEGLLRKRDAELEEARTRIVESELKAGELHSQNSSAAREYACAMDEQKRLYNELEQREAMTKSQLEHVIKEKAERDVAIRTLQEKTTHLTNETEQLRRQVHVLKQESADKEVKIVQLNKQNQQHQEDKAGLNMALDAKQQELELMKRKLQVKGTAGSTPAHSRISAISESSGSRRGSLGFATPVHRRPNSAIGMSHSSQAATPSTKADTVTDDLTTVKPNKIGLPINGPSLNPSVNFNLQATPGPRSATRHHLRSVNGAPSNSASRYNHHRRSSSATSTSSSIASGSEKENNRTKASRVSVPA